MAAENTVLVQMASEGITVTAASGDNGAYGDKTLTGYNVADPASQPYVTGVGGTTLFTGPGQIWEEEDVWNTSLTPFVDATGGGISSYWPIPDYQSITVSPVYVTINGGSSTYRNVPDVAAVGNPHTGVGIYSKSNGGWQQVGGTSVSAPIWAAYLSIVNAGLEYAGLGTLGYLNPILYDVGYWVRPFVIKAAASTITSDFYGDPSSSLYPVFDGNNGDAVLYPDYPGYSAGGQLTYFEYCNATGCGTLYGGLMAAQLLISGQGSGQAPGSIDTLTVKPMATTVDLKWSSATGAVAYAVTIAHAEVLNVNQCFLTKATSLKVTGLLPHNDTYSVTVWAFNANGFTYYNTTFNTK
jgi:subtilase family serine protease